MDIIIQNCYILPMNDDMYDGKRYFVGSICIKGNRIALITQDDIAHYISPETKVIKGEGRVVMPGLINTHTHVAMTLLRGYADDMELMEWLNSKIWPAEREMRSDDFYAGAMLGMAEMICSGTTTFVDMYFDVETHAKAVSDSGMRGYLGITLMDHNRDVVEASICDDVAKNHGSANGRVRLMIAPHAPYTCSPTTIQCAVSMAKKYNLILHTHLCETQKESDEIGDRYKVSPVEYYKNNGVFDVPTILAHGVKLSNDEIKFLSTIKTTVAHNAESNMKLGSGVAPISEMIKSGLNVSIGTDGASSNNNLDMIEELRSASLLQKAHTLNPCDMDAYTTLKMATVNGAKALGRGDELGQLKEGMLADMIMIDITKPHMYPHYNLVSNIVYSASGRDVVTTIVDGKILMEDGALTTICLEDIYKKVEQYKSRLELNKLDAN